MSIQPLNRLLSLDPVLTARAFRSEIDKVELLEKITWVAIAAIVSTILFFSLAMTPTGMTQLALFGLALSTPLLSMGATSLRQKAIALTKVAEIEEGVAQLMDDMDASEIKLFFEYHGICNVLNSNVPLEAYDRGIARYCYWQEKGMKEHKESKQKFNAEITNPAARLGARQFAYAQLVKDALPAYLNGEFMKWILNNPFSTLVDIRELGTIEAKPFDLWKFDQMYPPRNDHYFIFHDQSRKPLGLGEIERSLEEGTLDNLLFPV